MTTSVPGGRSFLVREVARVVSTLTDPAGAPKQGDEGAPDAWIQVHPPFRQAMADLRAGDEVVLLTWLHLADRHVLRVHPRGDPARAELGVFSTRSQDRPNPVGLHRATVVEVAEGRFRVDALEAVDGTPVLDVKPVLAPSGAER